MGTKTKESPKPVMRMGIRRVVGERVEGYVAEVKGGEAEGAEAEGEKPAGVHFVGEEADDGHSADGSDAARCDDEAGGEGGVAEQLLIEEGQDGDGGVDAYSEEKDEDAAEEEVAVL